VSRAAALGAHDGTLRRIVHGFKFGRCATLAIPLGGLLRDRHAAILAGVDFVVPVPLHASRRRRRGFDQAVELARRLGPPLLCALRRRRRTLPQATLGAHVRSANVAGAFAPSARLWLPAGRRALKGARVVLVDDVWTTGATLSACAEVLIGAGAAEVRALAVARALPSVPSPPPAPALAGGRSPGSAG
jgi:ComF family protein